MANFFFRRPFDSLIVKGILKCDLLGAGVEIEGEGACFALSAPALMGPGFAHEIREKESP
jgi:hypothetical protein